MEISEESKKIAIEFAEWLNINAFHPMNSLNWTRATCDKTLFGYNIEVTTEELFDRFINKEDWPTHYFKKYE